MPVCAQEFHFVYFDNFAEERAGKFEHDNLMKTFQRAFKRLMAKSFHQHSLLNNG